MNIYICYFLYFQLGLPVNGKVIKLHVNSTFHHKYKRNGRFKCEHCVYTTDIKANLRRHNLSHLGVKPHCCSICGKRFTRSDDRKRHVLTHFHA